MSIYHLDSTFQDTLNQIHQDGIPHLILNSDSVAFNRTWQCILIVDTFIIYP